MGELSCEFNFRNIQCNGICYIATTDSLNLLGIDWIEKLCLWDVPFNSICDASIPFSDGQFYDVASVVTRVSDFVKILQTNHTEVFSSNLGFCTKAKAMLYLESGTKPVFCPKRPVPYSVSDQLDAELLRLEQTGVLTKVNYSAWATPIVVVRKANGTIRLCGDFSTGLNKALQTHQYPLPVPEDLFAKLNGGTIFSKIDFSDAYLQVEIDDSCKELVTINTHRGLYRYNRLPFGVKCAPAIFQQIMDTMLSGLPFAMAYMDDIVIASPSLAAHQKHVEEVFSRIKEYGFSLQIQKCEFFLPQIKYLGFIIDQHGRRPDPAKISAIQNIQAPADKTKLQSFWDW